MRRRRRAPTIMICNVMRCSSQPNLYPVCSMGGACSTTVVMRPRAIFSCRSRSLLLHLGRWRHLPLLRGHGSLLWSRPTAVRAFEVRSRGVVKVVLEAG